MSRIGSLLLLFVLLPTVGAENEVKKTDNQVAEAFLLGQQLSEVKAALKSAERLSKGLKDKKLAKELNDLKMDATELEKEVRSLIEKRQPIPNSSRIALRLLAKHLELWSGRASRKVPNGKPPEGNGLKFDRDALLEDLQLFFENEDRRNELMRSKPVETPKKKKKE